MEEEPHLDLSWEGRQPCLLLSCQDNPSLQPHGDLYHLCHLDVHVERAHAWEVRVNGAQEGSHSAGVKQHVCHFYPLHLSLYPPPPARPFQSLCEGKGVQEEEEGKAACA